MSRWIVCAVAALSLHGGAIGQTKISTVEEYAKVMRSNVETGRAMNQALTTKSYPEARKALATARGNFVALEGFWAERKRDDAVSIVKDGLNQIDALDNMLEKNADLASVQKASQEFGLSTCAACHKLYREGDDQTGFRFKTGVF
jgi:hypothetical protein